MHLQPKCLRAPFAAQFHKWLCIYVMVQTHRKKCSRNEKSPPTGDANRNCLNMFEQSTSDTSYVYAFSLNLQVLKTRLGA